MNWVVLDTGNHWDILIRFFPGLCSVSFHASAISVTSYKSLSLQQDWPLPTSGLQTPKICSRNTVAQGQGLWPPIKSLSQDSRDLHGPHELSVVCYRIHVPGKAQAGAGCLGTGLPLVICGLVGLDLRETCGCQAGIASNLLPVLSLQVPGKVTDHRKTICHLRWVHRSLQFTQAI